MTIKQWLMRAYLLNSKIQKILERRRRLYDAACSTTSHMSQDVVSHSKINSSENNCLRYIDCSKQADAMIDELVDIKREIIDAIGSVQNEQIQTLLFERYINFGSWDKISKQMNININTVKGKLHSRSLAELSRFI